MNAFAGATSFLLLLQHAAEQATFERAPWDHADAILDAGRQHFQLDRAREQAVLALLADEAQEISPPRLGLRRDNVPSGEIARAGVDYFPLPHERLIRFPNLIPRCLARHVVHLIKIDVIGFETTQ